MSLTDLIGKRGEAVALSHLLIPRAAGSPAPFFELSHLGDKFRTLDYLGELAETGREVFLFFVQVKSTWKPLTTTQEPPRLRIEVSENDVRRMAAWPAPTYVVGVSHATGRVFIVSIHHGMTEAISSITTAHELTPETLRRLWDEVRGYWISRDMSRASSHFLDGEPA